MDLVYNESNGERAVELKFICEMLEKYNTAGDDILDVGGIPTDIEANRVIDNIVKRKNLNYKICDFRDHQRDHKGVTSTTELYKGDFVTLPIEQKFNTIIFLSSLEHFALCTEGDMNYKEDEDIKGFQKAIYLLKEGGKIFLTVPFGEPIWQPYHQNYDMLRIKKMSKGTKIQEQFIYKLCYDNQWILTKPENMKKIYYTNKCFGVGCFVFTKGE